MNRLKTRAQFQAVLAAGTMARTAHFALHRADLPLVSDDRALGSVQPLFPVRAVWMGAMVPKRWAKRAVTRNAIKRPIQNGLACQCTCGAFAVCVRPRRICQRELHRLKRVSAV